MSLTKQEWTYCSAKYDAKSFENQLTKSYLQKKMLI